MSSYARPYAHTHAIEVYQSTAGLDHFRPPVKSHSHVPKLLGAGMQPATLPSEPTLASLWM